MSTVDAQGDGAAPGSVARPEQLALFRPGHAFAARRVVRDRVYQESRLAACAVDPAIWGDRAEPALFGQDCFRAMAEAGHQVDGLVHTEQRIRLLAPVGVGEPLRQTGRIDRFDPHERGHILSRVFEFRRGDGTLAVISEVIGLVPDPARMGARRPDGEAGAGSRAPRPDPTEGLRRVAEKRMRPEDVTLFSSDVGNRIHFEPAFARGVGYRAPLAQGLQTAVWMLAPLAAAGPPDRLEARFRFLRPVHWDDAMTLWFAEIGEGTLARTLSPDGRVTAEMRATAHTGNG